MLRSRWVGWWPVPVLIVSSVGALSLGAGFVEPLRLQIVSALGPLQRLFGGPSPPSAPDSPGPADVQALRNQVLRQQEIIWQLTAQLRAFHAFRRQFPDLASHALPAEIVGCDTSALRRTVFVDAGSAQGVAPDGAVLVHSALVGRVVAVGPSRSRVLLINDPESAVPVIAMRTREQGIVQGTLEQTPRLSLEFVGRFAKLRHNDVVVTSGVGGVFPKGIVVGRIVSCMTPAGELFKKIKVQPTAELAQLERVLVLRPPKAAPVLGRKSPK